MEKFNNIYMLCSCEDKKHIPKEVEQMYFEQYGLRNKKKFFKSIKNTKL